jgi:hypothetical protein
MSCIVNPDGSITCSDSEAELTQLEMLAVASYTDRTSPGWSTKASNVNAQVAAVSQQLANRGTTVVLLVDANKLKNASTAT